MDVAQILVLALLVAHTQASPDGISVETAASQAKRHHNKLILRSFVSPTEASPDGIRVETNAMQADEDHSRLLRRRPKHKDAGMVQELRQSSMMHTDLQFDAGITSEQYAAGAAPARADAVRVPPAKSKGKMTKHRNHLFRRLLHKSRTAGRGATPEQDAGGASLVPTAAVQVPPENFNERRAKQDGSLPTRSSLNRSFAPESLVEEANRRTDIYHKHQEGSANSYSISRQFQKLKKAAARTAGWSIILGSIFGLIFALNASDSFLF